MKNNVKTKKIIFGVIIGVSAAIGVLLAVALAIYAKSGAASAHAGLLYAVAALMIILTALLSVLFAMIILKRKNSKPEEIEVSVGGQDITDKTEEKGIRFDGLSKLDENKLSFARADYDESATQIGRAHV